MEFVSQPESLSIQPFTLCAYFDGDMEDFEASMNAIFRRLFEDSSRWSEISSQQTTGSFFESIDINQRLLCCYCMLA